MHGNAPLTPEGRLRLCRRIEDGWTVAAAAESMNISRQCAHKWWRRYRARRRRRAAGPVEPAVVVSASDPGAGRTADRGVASVPQARPGPPGRHRRRPGVDRASGAGPSRREPVAVDGPPDRSGDPADRDQPLRRAGPHRRQETGPDPGRWRPPQARADAPQTAASAPSARRLHPHPHRHRRLPPARVLASSPASRTPSTASRSSTAPSPGSPQQGIAIERVLTDNGNGYRSHRAGETAAPSSASATPAPGPTGPPPTAKSNGSTAPSPTNGPTPGSGNQKPPEPAPLTASSTATTITDTTPPSAAHPPAESQPGRAQHLARLGAGAWARYFPGSWASNRSGAKHKSRARAMERERTAGIPMRRSRSIAHPAAVELDRLMSDTVPHAVELVILARHAKDARTRHRRQLLGLHRHWALTVPPSQTSLTINDEQPRLRGQRDVLFGASTLDIQSATEDDVHPQGVPVSLPAWVGLRVRSIRRRSQDQALAGTSLCVSPYRPSNALQPSRIRVADVGLQ